jgi:hypothetical protein
MIVDASIRLRFAAADKGLPVAEAPGVSGGRTNCPPGSGRARYWNPG